MAAVLGAGEPAPGPADAVAVSAQPGLGASLPTAGVIMPMAEPDRPWWLVPSLAVGGMLLITVVSLLAVLLLQTTGTSRADGGTPAPGEAAANGMALARPEAKTEAKTEAETEARSTAETAPRAIGPQPAPAPAARRDTRRPRKVRLRKRRPRRDRDVVVKPVRAQPKERHHRPRSISEILNGVGKIRPESPGAKPRASLPAQLERRDIQGGMSRVVGAARACGRRFSTSGRVSVRMVIAGATGRVLGVSPKGPQASSPTGRCVARALRSARFKRFARSRQSFYYTVILR